MLSSSCCAIEQGQHVLALALADVAGDVGTGCVERIEVGRDAVVDLLAEG